MQKMATVNIYTDAIQTLLEQHRPPRAAPPAERSPPAPQPPWGVLSRPLPIPPAGTGSASAAAFRWERDVTAALFDITQPRKPRRGSVGTLVVGSSTPWCLQDRHGRDDVLSVSHCHSGEKNHCPSLPPPWENKPKHVTDGPHLRKIQIDRNENTGAANMQCCHGLWGKAQHSGPITAVPE